MREGSQFTAESLSGGREVSSLQSLCREGGKSVHCSVCREGSQFTAESLSGGREVSSLQSLCRDGGKSVHC